MHQLLSFNLHYIVLKRLFNGYSTFIQPLVNILLVRTFHSFHRAISQASSSKLAKSLAQTWKSRICWTGAYLTLIPREDPKMVFYDWYIQAGSVALQVARESHNLKVVCSILAWGTLLNVY